MQLKVAEAAAQDVEEILRFYGVPTIASDRIATAIDQALLHLCEWPATGHRRSDLTPHDLLFWMVPPYFVVYRTRADLLIVVAILHTARNIPVLLQSRLSSTL